MIGHDMYTIVSVFIILTSLKRVLHYQGKWRRSALNEQKMANNRSIWNINGSTDAHGVLQYLDLQVLMIAEDDRLLLREQLRQGRATASCGHSVFVKYSFFVSFVLN
jgi:hypothetical protein